MPLIHFKLSISAAQYQHYYAGQVRNIQAQAFDGRQVRFPASALQPYLTHAGVHGEFVLEYDENNKFIALTQLKT